MVKKLIKYENINFLKKTLIPHIAVLGLALIVRLLMLFETESSAYDIFFTSMCIAFGLACAADLLLVFIFGVVRFYKNLYGDEGYLSLTLPVSPTEHIFAKLITAVIALIISVITIFAGLAIIFSGEMLTEIFKAGGYIFTKCWEWCGANTIAYILYLLIALILYAADVFMVFYGCLSIGQLAKKAKIGFSILAYFVYYFAGQVIGTIMLIYFTVIDEFRFMNAVADYFNKSPISAFHIAFICGIIYMLIKWFIYYFVIRTIMKKKINLV